VAGKNKRSQVAPSRQALPNVQDEEWVKVKPKRLHKKPEAQIPKKRVRLRTLICFGR